MQITARNAAQKLSNTLYNQSRYGFNFDLFIFFISVKINDPHCPPNDQSLGRQEEHLYCIYVFTFEILEKIDLHFSESLLINVF